MESTDTLIWESGWMLQCNSSEQAHRAAAYQQVVQLTRRSKSHLDHALRT
jgi:hypothetical protein